VSRWSQSPYSASRSCYIETLTCFPSLTGGPSRFYGFRYEISGPVADQASLVSIQERAASTGCFGWAQISPSGKVVGEARCAKERGKAFQAWLEAFAQSTKVDVLVSDQSDQ
jgi:hypothetical protein